MSENHCVFKTANELIYLGEVSILIGTVLYWVFIVQLGISQSVDRDGNGQSSSGFPKPDVIDIVFGQV